MASAEPYEPAIEDAELRRELERRLELIQDPAYDDPARRDLPIADICTLLGLIVAVVALCFLLLY